MPKPIHIALTFDASYWAPAYATMRSICLTTTRNRDLVFHLCHRTMTAEHKADLDAITTEFGSELRYYDIDAMPLFASVAGRARYNKRLSNIVYARLLFSEFLPPDVERLVYLDCDMMVRAPIEEIAEADLGPYPVGAVAEPYGMRIKMGRDLRAKADLFRSAEPYFNAGLLVIDMQGWREADIVHRLEQAIKDGTMARLYYDQDLLNLIFARKWFPFVQTWNLVNPRRLHESLNPQLLHYTGAGKPWLLRYRFSKVAFVSLYRHVMTRELYGRYARYRMDRRWEKLKRRFGLGKR